MNTDVHPRQRLIEVSLTAIGIAAILGSLFLGELTPDRVLDALKDLVSFLITVAVFVLGLSVYHTLSRKDFVGKFLEHLAEWASNNKFLIDEGSAEEDRGKIDKKRSYGMAVYPESVLTATEPIGIQKRKTGNFVFIPTNEELRKLASGVKNFL